MLATMQVAFRLALWLVELSFSLLAMMVGILLILQIMMSLSQSDPLPRNWDDLLSPIMAIGLTFVLLVEMHTVRQRTLPVHIRAINMELWPGPRWLALTYPELQH